MVSKSIPGLRHGRWLLMALLAAAYQLPAAGYKILPWTPRAITSYPAALTSEGVTIAVEPLLTDALAAQVFDRPDILARGIMPLAIVIFNSNAFPVEVNGLTTELLWQEDRQRTMDPIDVVQRLYESKPSKKIVVPIPIPKITIMKSHAEACQDFKGKFLGVKQVEPNSTAGGFLFIKTTGVTDLRKALEAAKIYIRNLYGKDGVPMMFFEIDLKPAIDSLPRK